METHLIETIFFLSVFTFEKPFWSDINPPVFTWPKFVTFYPSNNLVGWLFGFYGVINLCRLFNTKSIFMQIVLFQTIQFSMSTQFVKKFLFQAIQFSQTVLIQLSISIDFIYTKLNVKTVLY